jgi:hypothetical protein
MYSSYITYLCNLHININLVSIFIQQTINKKKWKKTIKIALELL